MRLSEHEDDALFQDAGRGDRAAFTRLVDRHRGRLMGLAMRVIGDRAVAEDLIQEVFIRAWRTAPRFRAMGAGRSGAGAWLSRVTLNLAIDHARRPRSLPLEGAVDPLDPALPADEEMIAGERRQTLIRAIAALPARQRAAIALAYDEGLSNAEGALALDVSVGAYELLLVRARRSLRQAFAPTSRN